MDFVKYHVCYCDYIVCDGAGAEREARAVCDRHSGVGATGLVAVRENPFRAKFFRPDGSEAPLDLSALLCAAAYLCERCGSPRVGIITECGVRDAQIVSRGEMCVDFPPPKTDGIKIRRADISSPIEYIKFEFAGAPRAVCPTDDIYGAILFGLGEKMSVYRAFSSGADADFVRVLSRDKIEVRSYERGAGYVTSGSGAAAAASVLLSLGRCEREVGVSVDCGKMRVYLEERPRIAASVVKVMTAKTT